jgi:hypothetical protein
MNKTMTVTTAGLAAFAMCFALAGCNSGDKTESKTMTSSSTSASATTSSETSPTAGAAGKHMTIRDYIKENNVTEQAVKRGDPTAPKIDLPTPPGWKDAGRATPEWAWGAIVYTNPGANADPPSVIAIVSKLTGNVDPAKVLEYAPGELQNLTDFEPLSEPTKTTLSGFDAVQLGGTYKKDGKQRLVGQKTVVIPGQDGLYVLQMNADAPKGQEGPLMDATSVIDKGTTITP